MNRETTLANLTRIEKRADLAKALGPDFRLSQSPLDIYEFVNTARSVMAHSDASEVIRKSLSWKWAIAWFVTGLAWGYFL